MSLQAWIPMSVHHANRVPRHHRTTPERIASQAIAAPSSVSHRPYRHGLNRVVLYTGDVAISTSPTVLETMLGSCVAVCLFDPVRQIGGMNHILLPGDEDARGARFGVHAMELLINELMKQGTDRKSLVAKAFGGACVFEGMDRIKIGEKNSAFIRSFLRVERIPLVAQRLGGKNAVHVYFHTNTGKAIVRTVDGSALPRIIQNEDAYGRMRDAGAKDNDEVTLF